MKQQYTNKHVSLSTRPQYIWANLFSLLLLLNVASEQQRSIPQSLFMKRSGIEFTSYRTRRPMLWKKIYKYKIAICTYFYLKICREPSWSWLYGGWIYNYLYYQCQSPLKFWVRTSFRRDVLDITLCDKVCQKLEAGLWFSPGTPVSSTNKTDRHDITEILLKVTLNNINQIISLLVKMKVIRDSNYSCYFIFKSFGFHTIWFWAPDEG